LSRADTTLNKHTLVPLVSFRTHYRSMHSSPFPSGETPLYCAAHHAHLEIVTLLLSYQADVNAKGGPQ